MNEEDEKFEMQLRRWQPRQPGPGIRQRIAQDLTCPAPSRSWWERLGFSHPLAAAGWGLALPAIVALLVGNVTPSPPAATVRPSQTSTGSQIAGGQVADHFVDAQTTQTSRVYAVSDEGVVLNSDQQPMRRIRYFSEETLTLRDPRKKTVMKMTRPREDVVLRPVTTL